MDSPLLQRRIERALGRGGNAVKHAIKSHLVELFAVLGLLVLAAAIGAYILSQQRFCASAHRSRPRW